MGILIGLRKNLDDTIPKHARDVARRLQRLEDEIAEAREEQRWLLSVAGAAGIEIPDEIYEADGTASRETDGDDVVPIAA